MLRPDYNKDSAVANAVAGVAPTEPAEDILSRSTVDSTYLNLDGSSVMGGGLDMGRFRTRNVREPSLGSDVGTKGYIDMSVVPLASTVAELSNSVVKSEGSSVMTENLDMGRNSIKNLRDPALGSDAATKGYFDRNNALNVRYDGATADINMQQHKITTLLDPRDAQDCATKKYVDDNNMFAD